MLKRKPMIRPPSPTIPSTSHWLQHNPTNTKAKRWPLLKAGHSVRHLYLPNGKGLAGFIEIDGQPYTYSKAQELFGDKLKLLSK